MIDIVKYTPKIYSSESRDYQVIAKLYTALLNLSRSYSNSMDVWGNNSDSSISLLKAKTLNFRPKHQWDNESLSTVTSCFKYLVKNKGTEAAALDCVNILSRVNNIKGDATAEYENKTNTLILKIPETLATIGIVEDLIRYVIPAGVCYRIIKFKSISGDEDTQVDLLNNVSTSKVNNSNISIYNTENTTGTITHNFVNDGENR